MCVCVLSHHISGQVAEVVKGTLQGVAVHVQNDHILQRPTAHSLNDNKMWGEFLLVFFSSHQSIQSEFSTLNLFNFPVTTVS